MVYTGLPYEYGFFIKVRAYEYIWFSAWTLVGEEEESFTLYYDDSDWETKQIIKENEWHHIAVSREGNTFRIFLDGNEVASDTSTIVMPDTSLCSDPEDWTLRVTSPEGT